MQIDFTGHRLEITPALKQYTIDKFERLERHFSKIMSVNVTFNVEKLRHIAEASISVPKAELRASCNSENLYSAIDELVDKLDRQIIKHKEKIKNHREPRDIIMTDPDSE